MFIAFYPQSILKWQLKDMVERQTHTKHATPRRVVQDRKRRGVEDSRKGQTLSDHFTTWWRVITNSKEVNILFRNSKPNQLKNSSLYVYVLSSQTYLCALHGDQSALLEQSRGKQIALLKSPWEQQRQQKEEAQRLTEKLSQALHFLQFPDRINRQKALWLHWSAL